MFGLGTIINTAGIIIGGIFGIFFGKLLKDRIRETLCKCCGVSVIIIGLAGALEGMLSIEEGNIVSGRSLLLVLSLILGAFIGELIDLDGLLERFGNFLKRKTGSSKDKMFTEGFVNASLTVCVGAMAIIGAMEDGINGDISILVTKTILDTIIVFVMAGTMGKGCIFSALPVFLVQGLFTCIAVLIKPILIDMAITNISIVGSALIMCVGINLLLGKTIRVANMLPALLFAVAFAYIPLGI